MDFQKTQIREGFKLSWSYSYDDSLYVPVDLIELIIEFTVDITIDIVPEKEDYCIIKSVPIPLNKDVWLLILEFAGYLGQCGRCRNLVFFRHKQYLL